MQILRGAAASFRKSVMLHSIGNVVTAGPPPMVINQFVAHLLWLGGEPLLPGRTYLLQAGTRTVRCAVSRLRHRVDVDTLTEQAATTLAMNDIGVVNISASEPLVCEPYRANRDLGGFILIDAASNQTVAAGMLDFVLHSAANVHWQEFTVSKDQRAGQKLQRPCVLWFTGLSGAGKSTIADLVERRLGEMGRHTYLLDGDNLRHGLNRDLGFTTEARVENVRRVREVARLFVDAGLIVLASLISPFRAERDAARQLVANGEFIEIHVATPLAECERRDPKGLYQRARSGLLPNFTGIDSPYEPPTAPELILDTSAVSAEQAACRVIDYLRKGGYV